MTGSCPLVPLPPVLCTCPLHHSPPHTFCRTTSAGSASRPHNQKLTKSIVESKANVWSPCPLANLPTTIHSTAHPPTLLPITDDEHLIPLSRNDVRQNMNYRIQNMAWTSNLGLFNVYNLQKPCRLPWTLDSPRVADLVIDGKHGVLVSHLIGNGRLGLRG